MKISTMRVYLTENCNARCKNCFNVNSRSNAEIDLVKFDKLCNYLAKNGITYLKIMGGEPTVHSDYLKMISIAQKNFSMISVFTNSINDNILLTELRERDTITYNFNFEKSLSKDKLLLNKPGKRFLEIQITKLSDEEKILNRIIELNNYDTLKIIPSFTLDCTSNIFLDRDIVIQKLNFLQRELNRINIRYGYDHRMPYCFLHESGITLKQGTCFCSISSSGLIDAKLNLRFCNQHPEILICIIEENKFIPWQIVLNHLLLSYYKNQINGLNKICLNCIFYSKLCNGGCFINSEKISTEDILKYSPFPTS
jgi:MoaA/NifB/PqqE/SkfB family radical SAM enzyme